MKTFLCPILMAWLQYYVLFAVLYGAGARNLGTGACALLGLMLPITYMPASVLAGFLLNERNAKRYLFNATLACGLAAVVCLNLTMFLPLVVAIGVFGVTNAFFFNSFQTFMRTDPSSELPLKRSVSLYNFAWSIGAGAGILTAGLLYSLGDLALTCAAVLATALMLWLLLVKKSSTDEKKADSAKPKIEEGASGARLASPIYVVVGWMMVFTVQFAQRPIFTFLPPLFAKDGTSSLMASLPLFAMYALQAFTALFMWRFRDRMYRKTPIFATQILAALVFLSLWAWPCYAVCLGALLLLGIYGGFAYFCAIYYVSNSERSSFNIGINESLVALGGVSGLFAGDAWMKASGSSSQIYMLCAISVAISTLLQIIVARKAKDELIA